MILLAFAILGTACTPDDQEDELIIIEETKPELVNELPQFYKPAAEEDYAAKLPKFTLIADSRSGVGAPNDLAFHPDEERKDELWILNEGHVNQGGFTVTLTDAGKKDQRADMRRDGNAWHFMSMPTSLAFGDNGNWATGVGVQDANHNDGTFAGPSLWTSDMEIHAITGRQPSAEVNGSHLDMLHGSPFAMGIAHDKDNAYWIFDGYHGHIVRYDFQAPHYPGGHDHSDGLVHRYTEVKVVRHESLPSHMILDKESGWLYINETSKSRILRMNTNTGAKLKELALINEELQQHWEMHQVSWEVFASTGLVDPVGIALSGTTLFVTDHGTGDIIAFDTASKAEIDRVNAGEGIRGITLGPDARLWFTNYQTNQVFRLDPQ
ncbi:MAG: hypothetical protein H0U74_16410 [Bradymonadaceae bacterium]|nr:hypothetical protein [Lujinxingiaceae bacterium]